MTQEPVTQADAAERIFALARKARKLRAGRCVADPYLLAKAGLIFMRVTQNAVRFGRQQSPGNQEQENAETQPAFATRPEHHTL
jgi:hypothetical protein